MNEKEKMILKIEEDLKDTLENDLIKQKVNNKEVKIKDVKYVGKVEWKDKINNKNISDNVLFVDVEIKEIDENGNERITEQRKCYLGEKCIGGTIGDNELVYNNLIQNSEPDKIKAINELVHNTSKENIESNSLNKLKIKEISEILTEHYGRKVSEEEAKKLIEEMDESEIQEVKKEQEEFKDNYNDKNKLSEKQTENIKVNGIQKTDLNKKIDGKETLGKRLDLEGFDSLYVVYSDKVDDITSGIKRNNTTYSLVGVSKDGKAKVLNDEFEMDRSVGTDTNKETTKIRANNTATRDNKDLSIYTRKSNGMSVGCENDQGHVNMFVYQKTLEENENVGIQVETHQTPRIPLETREVMNKNKGKYQADKVQNEIKYHTDVGCELDNVKDYDGMETSFSHEHININSCVQDILNYENENGEEKIKEVFTEKEVQDKLLSEIEKNKNKLSFDKIVDNVKQDMNLDAEIFDREHNIEKK